MMTGGTGFQQLLVARREIWLDELAEAVAKRHARLRQSYARWERKAGTVERRLTAALAKAALHDPRLSVSVETQIVLVLGLILGALAGWPYLESLGRPFPITLLTAVGVGLLELVLAAACGAMSYAVVLDEYGSVFELTPRQRTWSIILAAVFGVLTLLLVIPLALVRADGVLDFSLWLVIGLAAAAIGAYFGAAVLDNRHHLEAAYWERSLHKLEERMDAVVEQGGVLDLSALARGRTLCTTANEILTHGTLAYERSFHRHDRRPGAVPPPVPVISSYTDGELADRLFRGRRNRRSSSDRRRARRRLDPGEGGT